MAVVAGRRGRASLEDVGDVAQRSHAAVDGQVSLGRGGAAGAGARQWLGGRRRWPRAVLIWRLAGLESVARQATRSAASAGHLAELMSNTASALATERPYVMRGAPRGC